MSTLKRLSSVATIATLCLFVTACKQELYSDLSQYDANKMASVLWEAGIDVERQKHKGNTYSLMVEDSQQGRAIGILACAGLPERQFANFETIFADGNVMVPSPQVNHAKLTYAKSQELSRMISEIEGIASSQVILNIPMQDPLSKDPQAASASVAIHHMPGFDTSGLMPRIKLLIESSVENLDYDQVTVALFPLSGAQQKVAGCVDQMSTSFASASGTNGGGNGGPGQPRLMNSDQPQTMLALMAGAGILLLLGLLLIRMVGGRSRPEPVSAGQRGQRRIQEEWEENPVSVRQRSVRHAPDRYRKR